MTHDLVSLLSQYGLALVFANVLIEQIGLPVPAMEGSTHGSPPATKFKSCRRRTRRRSCPWPPVRVGRNPKPEFRVNDAELSRPDALSCEPYRVANAQTSRVRRREV